MNPERGTTGDRKTEKALPSGKSTYGVMEEMRHRTPSTGRAFLSKEVPRSTGAGAVHTHGASDYYVTCVSVAEPHRSRKKEPAGD